MCEEFYMQNDYNEAHEPAVTAEELAEMLHEDDLEVFVIDDQAVVYDCDGLQL